MISVQHLAFGCKDLARSEAFFREHLGFQRVRVFNSGTPGAFLMMRLGTCCLELFPAGVDASAAEQSVGFRHLAFEVSDIEAKVKEFRAAGVDMGDIIDCSAHVPKMKVCFFRDPDGNTLELMENYTDDADLLSA